MRKFWHSLSSQCSRWIFLAIVFSNLLVATVSYEWVRNNEIFEQRKNLNGLLETMQNTARAACFANNSVLAQEVVDGLRLNHLVSGAAIWSNGMLLAQSGVSFSARESDEKASHVLTHSVLSPFDDKEIIGQIAIHLDQKIINQEANRSTRFVGTLLTYQAVLLIVVVNFVVLLLIVQPVKRVVTDLSGLLPFDGKTIDKPKNHHHDELGLLVDEINWLSQRLNDVYSKEVNLRIHLEQDKNRFRSIFEFAQTGLFVIDNTGHILSHNRCFSEYLDIEETQINLFETKLSKNADQLQALLLHPESSPAYFELINVAGIPYWLELSLNRINNQSLQGILNDITRLKYQEQQQRDIAMTDPLTGINNRRGFDTYIQDLFISNQSAFSHPFALMLIDLDYFKQVNDVYGHAAGDVVLQYAAKVLKSAVRISDFVSRLGGDEFAIIVENCNHADIASAIANMIITRISYPIALEDGNLAQIGASIGIALCDGDCQTLKKLFDKADEALYQAKAEGRNCVRIYTQIA